MNDKTTLAYLYPTGGKVHGQFVESLLDTLARDQHKNKRINMNVVAQTSGPNLDQSRNEVVAYFLGSRRDWLMFFDSDMVWDGGTFMSFLDDAHVSKPVIGGLYNQYDESAGIAVPLVFDEKDKRVDLPDLLGSEGPFQCGTIGAGALLIHRSVLLKMDRGEWFSTKEEGMKEDLAFCDRVRALDIPIYVDPKFRLGHLKVVAV